MPFTDPEERRAYHKAYNAAYGKEYRRRNREKLRAYSADRNRAKNGWTPEQFEAAWAAQAGRCAVCQVQMLRVGRGDDVACADHSHSSGTARGLLCRTCNTAVGLLGDSPAVLRLAALYLQEHGVR